MKKLMIFLLALLAGCGGMDDLAPEVCDTLDPVMLEVGESSETVTCFTDPEGERLTLSAVSSDDLVATAQILGEVVAVMAHAEGGATITVTAMDPGGLSVDASFQVGVTGPPEPETLLDDDFTALLSSWTPSHVSESGVEGGSVWLASDNKDEIATLWHEVDRAENPIINARVTNGTDDFWSTLLIDTGDPRITTIVVIFGADISRMSPNAPVSDYLALVWDTNLPGWGVLLFGESDALKGPGVAMDVTVEVNEQNIRILVDGRIVVEESRDSLIPTTILRVGIGGTWPEDVPPTTESRVYFDRIEVIGLKTGN